MIVEHEREAEHLLWPVQTPDLNILKTLRGIGRESERIGRGLGGSQFLPPASHRGHGHCSGRGMTTVQDLHLSFQRRIDAILQKEALHHTNKLLWS